MPIDEGRRSAESSWEDEGSHAFIA